MALGSSADPCNPNDLSIFDDNHFSQSIAD